MGNDAIEKLKKQIESGYSLPALSPVAVKLVEIASDDNCSLNDLISLIEKDPSLAVNLLKMANSAFFKSGQPVAKPPAGNNEDRVSSAPCDGSFAVVEEHLSYGESRASRL